MFRVERPRRTNYITALGIQAPRTTELLSSCYKGQMPSDINERIKNKALGMTLSLDQEAGGQDRIRNYKPQPFISPLVTHFLQMAHIPEDP